MVYFPRLLAVGVLPFLVRPVLVSSLRLRDSGTKFPLSRRSTTAHCQPFSTTFSEGAVSANPYDNAPFLAVSPSDSYQIVEESGLQLLLRKPSGNIETKDGVNSVLAQGATINSTFTLQYGKVTFEVQAPAVAGIVTAAILIADQHDEIDIELVGGDPKHWQTNVYAPNPNDTQTLWGVFGEINDIGTVDSSDPTLSTFHNYTIDWTQDKITWSVDSHVVRTLTPGQTVINGTTHFPTHASRIQLGIWDASSPIGTCQWAKGPINWKKAKQTTSAVVRSVIIECP